MSTVVEITKPGMDLSAIATVKEVAEYFKVSSPVIHKWIKGGKLRAHNFGTPGKSLYRIPWAEVVRANSQMQEG